MTAMILISFAYDDLLCDQCKKGFSLYYAYHVLLLNYHNATWAKWENVRFFFLMWPTWLILLLVIFY